MLKEMIAQQAYLCTNNPTLTAENQTFNIKQYEISSIASQRANPTPGLLDCT